MCISRIPALETLSARVARASIRAASPRRPGSRGRVPAPVGGPPTTRMQEMKRTTWAALAGALAILGALPAAAVAAGVAPSWNQTTTFKVVNGTHGAWPDAQVYWAIIGRDPANGQFVRVDTNGALVPMALSDNGALWKNGQPYSNYFHTLAEKGKVTIPKIDSARLYLSVGG